MDMVNTWHAKKERNAIGMRRVVIALLLAAAVSAFGKTNCVDCVKGADDTSHGSSADFTITDLSVVDE